MDSTTPDWTQSGPSDPSDYLTGGEEPAATGRREAGDTVPFATGATWPDQPTGVTWPNQTVPVAPPGWYPDPWADGQHRFWSGQTWTADAFPNGPAGAYPDTSQWAATAPGQPAPASYPASGESPPPPHWLPGAGPGGTAGTGPAQADVAGWDWGGPPTASPTAGGGDERWRTPPTPAPPRPPSGRGLAVVAAIVGLIVGLVAVIGVDLIRRDRTPSPPATAAEPQQPAPTVPNTTPAAPADPSSSVLSGLVVRQADVPSTAIVEPLPGGTQVSGQTTLDLCNGTFASESLRTARLQVTAGDAQGNAFLSTEAVLYASPSATAQAFAELRATAAGCPATPVVSPVGEPTVTTTFRPAPDAAWPQTPTVQRLAFDFVSTDTSGQAQHSVAVYLSRGRVLMGVYFPQPDGAQAAVDGQTSVAGIVGVFAGRMAQLPASVVNGG